MLKRARGAVLRRLHPPGAREGYFDTLAPFYDDWWTRTGRMANTEQLRPGWKDEVTTLQATIEAFEPVPTLDVGCGTGFLTRWLPGLVVGLDASKAMLEIAHRQAPEAIFVQGDALSLPFPDGSFGRLFASHIYGHLDRAERQRFRREARRVADELVIVDTAGESRERAPSNSGGCPMARAGGCSSSRSRPSGSSTSSNPVRCFTAASTSSWSGPLRPRQAVWAARYRGQPKSMPVSS